MIRVIPSLLAAALLAAPVAATAAEVDVQQLYNKHCKNCHGADGKAETKMGKKHEIDSFADAEWQAKHSDEKIRDVIANGKPKTKMKAYKTKLSAEQIDALTKYVRTFNPAK
jgi:mono/diheme cytochrome c family protein